MRIFTILILLITINYTAYARKYYVSNGGNDSDDGRSPATAWASINKINNTSLQPGDSIFFESGGLWREALEIPSSGSESAYIYFGSYGEGPRPRIYGSDTSGWSVYANNIWVSDGTFENPATGYPGGVFFEADDTTYWGPAQKALIGDLSADRDWTWYNGNIYIYSSSDPASEYSSVEVSQRDVGIYYNEQDYLSFDNLDIRYSKLAGFKESWPFNNETGLEIKNSHVSHIGIKGSRVGYGIEFWHSDSHVHNNIIHDCGRRATSTRPQDAPSGRLHDVLIEYNTIYNCYHAGIGIAAATDATFENLTIRYNYIYETEGQHTDAPEGYSMTHIGITGKENADRLSNVMVYGNISVAPTQNAIILNHAQDIAIYNNTFYGTNQNSDAFNGQLYMQGTTHDIEVKNNIFYNNNVFSRNNFWPFIYSTFEPDINSIDVDYNLYYNEDEDNMIFNLQESGGSFYLNDWDSYLNATGWDAHSQKPQDPMFVSPPTDFRLREGSPAIGAGLDVGLEYDYDGKSLNSPPSIGALEKKAASTSDPSPDKDSQNNDSQDEDIQNEDLLIYPNPSDGDFHIVLPDYLSDSEGEIRLRVYSFSGALIHESVREGQRELLCSLNLPAGISFLRISNNNQMFATGKLIIRK